MRNQTGFGTLIAIIGFGVLVGPGVTHSQTEGAVQYPPLSIGEDAQPPPPARMVPQIVSPRRVELDASVSSLPPQPVSNRRYLGPDTGTDPIPIQPFRLGSAAPVPPTEIGN